VHLSAIPTDAQAEPVVDSLKKFKFDRVPSLIPEDEEDEDPSVISVYGSKWAAHDLPKLEMPEKEMPREIVYRMIKSVAYHKLIGSTALILCYAGTILLSTATQRSSQYMELGRLDRQMLMDS
jgi:hypothetical protein